MIGPRQAHSEDASSAEFELSVKGDLGKLTERGVDHIVRQCGEIAGLGALNVRVLRQSYAISLFHEGLPDQDVGYRLGIKDPESLQRFKALAASEKEVPLNVISEEIASKSSSEIPEQEDPIILTKKQMKLLMVGAIVTGVLLRVFQRDQE